MGRRVALQGLSAPATVAPVSSYIDYGARLINAAGGISMKVQSSVSGSIA